MAQVDPQAVGRVRLLWGAQLETGSAGVACDQQPVAGLLKRWTLPSLAETVDIDHSLGKSLRGFLRQIVTDPTG